MPSFEWIDEIISRLEDKFHLVGNADSVIGFEQNQYLKGLEYLAENTMMKKAAELAKGIKEIIPGI